MVVTDVGKRTITIVQRYRGASYDKTDNFEGLLLQQVNGRSRIRGGDGKYWKVRNEVR